MSERSHLFSAHLLQSWIGRMEIDSWRGGGKVGAGGCNLTVNDFPRPQTTRWALGYPVAIPKSLRSNRSLTYVMPEFPPVEK